MGCTSSALLVAEVETLRKEVAFLNTTLREEREQKDSLRCEMTKATTAVMTLSQENQKLAYLLHSRKNSEVPLEAKVFESSKEEFTKMKEWSEQEIETGNSVLSTLLTNSDLTPKDENYKEISSLLSKIKESLYEPSDLIELCKLRAEFIEDLLQDCVEFRKEAISLIKLIEATVVAGLRLVRGEDSDQFVKTLQSAQGKEKLRVIRNIIKKFGFNGSYAAITDVDRERELGEQVQTLIHQVRVYESKIKKLELTIEELEEAVEEDMMESESEATPAPAEEQKTFQRRLSRRPTVVEGMNPLQGELNRAHERLKVYDEHMHDVQISAKAAREKGSKEAILKLMIGLETMAVAVKEHGSGNTGYGAPHY